MQRHTSQIHPSHSSPEASLCLRSALIVIERRMLDCVSVFRTASTANFDVLVGSTVTHANQNTSKNSFMAASDTSDRLFKFSRSSAASASSTLRNMIAGS